ncbi:MAG: hypothetical protein ACTHMC_22410 [Pseudobacter sp.]|uniref:hypothetical protein n=1 Tax=Pseudobacter sp. TaxID=2045420 RepID=UPI003F81D357
MKTSNKLILAIFLLAVLLPVLVVGTILARYKSGNFSWEKEENELTTYSYTGKQHLTLRGINNLTVYPSDSLYATIETHYGLPVKERQSGDSVLLFGDSTYYRYDTLQNGTVDKQFITENSYDVVKLYLPPGFDLKLEDCEGVYLKEGRKTKPVENITMHLVNSDLLTTGYYQGTPNPIRNLFLKLDNSKAELSLLSPVSALQVSLNQESELSISGLEVQQITMSYDSSSVLKATGDQLKKINQKK